MAASSSSSRTNVAIYVNIPTLGIAKKIVFACTEHVAEVVRHIQNDLGFPVVQAFGLLDCGTGRWCADTSTLEECGFKPDPGASILPTYACELKVRKDSSATLQDGSVRFLPAVPSGDEPYVQISLVAHQPKTVVVGLSRGSTVGMVLVLLKSDPSTRPPGTQSEVDSYGLVANIFDKTSGTHRLTLTLAESAVYGESAFDHTSAISFAPIKVCSYVYAFLDPTDFHSPPTEVTLSMESHCTVSYLLQRLMVVANSKVDPTTVEALMYQPDVVALKNCGVVLPPSSVLSVHGHTLHIRVATRPRLENTVAMTANTIWATIHAAVQPPLRVDALLDTNASLTELQDLFWRAHPSRFDNTVEWTFWVTSGSGLKGSKKGKQKKAEPTQRLRELQLGTGSMIELRPGKKLLGAMPSSAASSSSSLVSQASLHSLETIVGKLGPTTRSTGILIRESYGVFGVDTPMLPFVTDTPKLGYRSDRPLSVPKLLTQLKRAMDANSLPTADGVFRQGGAEATIKSIVEGFIANSTSAEERKQADRLEFVHSLAAVLKRWLGCLPHPIFESIQLNDYNDPNPTSILEKLPQPAQDISLWVLALLGETATFSRFNRMDSSNLAIVFAPLVIRFPEDDVMLGVELTKLVTCFLQRLIDERIDQDHVPDVSPEFLAPPPPPIAALLSHRSS